MHLLQHTITLILLICNLSILPTPTLAQQHPQLIGHIQHYTIQDNETLYDIARRYNLGINDLIKANPTIDIWIPKIGSTIIIPTQYLPPDAPQKGIVINLAESRLYYFPPNPSDKILTFPISIGTEFTNTPMGMTKINKKRKNPVWIPPESIRKTNPSLPKIVPAGEDNPLGQYALNLDNHHNPKWTNIAIHGTNKPWSIGTASSHGCIRLYPEHIEKLYNKVSVGTQVNIVDQAIKISLINNQLYIESHNNNKKSASLDIEELVYQKINRYEPNINWNIIADTIQLSTGIPTPISTKTIK